MLPWGKTVLRGVGGPQRYNSDQACADIAASTREPGCQRTMGIVADTLHRLSEHRHIKALLQPKWINKWKKGGRMKWKRGCRAAI